MKLRNVAGIPMMLGLGTALLLASPVRAQQEVDPDTFDVNPGTVVAEEAKAPAEMPTAMSTANVENATPQQAVVYAALFTPKHSVTSAFLAGAEMITLRAPRER